MGAVARLIEAAGFGLVTASIIGLAAVAVSLQVSVTNFVNFAYGEYMTFGAYAAWTAARQGINFFVAVLIGGLAVGLLAVATHIVAFRPFMRDNRKPVTLLVVGIGVSFILQNVITIIWGPQPNRFNVTLGSAIRLGPLSLTPGDLVIIGTSAVLLISLHAVLQHTKAGKALRATSSNRDLARASGIDTERAILATWFIGGILAAIAGVALALEENSLQPTTGFNELFVIFGAVILGGTGRPYGALLGALVVGMLTEISGMYVDAAYKTAIAFTFVIVLLLIRPQGLLTAAGKTS